MDINHNNDSKAQQEHERENDLQLKQAEDEEIDKGFDKRLDGPNRPAE